MLGVVASGFNLYFAQFQRSVQNKDGPLYPRKEPDLSIWHYED